MKYEVKYYQPITIDNPYRSLRPEEPKYININADSLDEFEDLLTLKMKELNITSECISNINTEESIEEYNKWKIKNHRINMEE